MLDATVDAAIAHKVLAGEGTGPAELYDRYGPALYAYCYSMLEDQEQAADAVRITLMIAVGRLGRLRDPSRLRPWLYALARNECRYRMKAPEAQDQAGVGASPAAAEPGCARAIVVTAMRRLSLDDREAAELCLRHYVLGPDLADALGIPLKRAYAMVARARPQLRRTFGELLVAYRGRKDCPDLAGMLADWDGEPTALVHRRVRRHLGFCQTCRDREHRELQAEALAALLAESGPPVPPTGLRDDVMQSLAAIMLEMAAQQDMIGDLAARHVGWLGPSGFPAPRSRRGNWRAGRLPQFAG